MFFTVGKKDKERQDALGWLLSCHQKIREMTALTRRLSDAQPTNLSEISEAAQQAHRYFTIALPLHEQDEEDSLLPRLLRQAPTLDNTLSAMKEEHQAINKLLDPLVLALERLIQTPADLPLLQVDLSLWVRSLESSFSSHLLQEETLIFPAAEKLPQEELANILSEMKQRRGL